MTLGSYLPFETAATRLKSMFSHPVLEGVELD